jgi:osmotically-inducible protein OsmY
MRGQQHRYQDEGRNEGRELQHRPDDQPTSPERGGEWYGYIQPYRYYGPGYRGVGYYSVMYQGRDPHQPVESGMAGDERPFDERGVSYRQDPATGTAWEGHPIGHGSDAWSDRARQWGQFGGRHTGRGPKGYRRSDERIREDVSDKLMEHPDLDASEIEVKVSNGEVTLSGLVDSRWAKRLAEDIAESSTGVRDVMNQLRVPSEMSMSKKEASAAPSGQARNGRRPVESKR